MRKSARFASSVCAVFAAAVLGHACGQQLPLKVEHVQRLPNSHNPELLYWFISPSEMAQDQWKRHLKTIEDNGTFNFLFLTAREGADFYDTAKVKPFFQEVVQDAHAHGIKVGLQLWTREKDTPPGQCEGVVVEQELQVDAQGHAEFSAESRGTRSHETKDGRLESNFAAVRSEVLAGYAFTKTGDGRYAPGSLKDVTARIKVLDSTRSSLKASIQDPSLAGKTLYVMTVHYHQFPDMFGSYIRDAFRQAMDSYRDIGFDGTALDEFRYMLKGRSGVLPFRERIYTPGMAAFFHQHTGGDLKQALFAMRYAVAGEEDVHTRAINNYFEILQEGPLAVEQFFYKEAERVFGPSAFHGIHDTFHNGLEADEIWSTGINWWSVPRLYGQTDESTPMTTREGIAMAHRKAVEYNQFYNRDLHKLLDEGMIDARFNGRVHWHGMNDQHGWGIDIIRPDALAGISAVEDKVRLLNAFDAPRPKFNVLYLFGFPALLNWDQPQGERNDWDINGNLHAEQKAQLGWRSGYLGPLAPTTLLENGTIQVDDRGGMTFGGERFTAVVMIGPEFSKAETTRQLQKFVAGGGKLLLDGTQTSDFAGKDARAAIAQLASQAVGQGVSEENLARLGVPKLSVSNGALYTDGSVILADTDSLLEHKPIPFEIEIAGHTYTGTYEGLVALKAGQDGSVEKFAAGGANSLLCDGKPLLTLDQRADVVFHRSKDRYEITVVGNATPELH